MKRRLLLASVFALLLLPAVVLGRIAGASAQPPPIEQTLVREGDFALRLAAVLRVGQFSTEAEAEERLAALGISPRNGWIADYPMTPDITIEVREAVAAAASAGRLPMSTEEALALVQSVNAELGLSVYSEAYPTSGGEQAYGQYYDAGAIQDYYYGYGPPTITYYTPPLDYYYLYSWVPYSFWWGGFAFGGYFILNDFHRTVVINKGFHRGHPPRHKIISNHYRDKRTGRFRKVDPVTRISGNRNRHTRNPSPPRAFRPGQQHRGAASILARDVERRRANSGRQSEFNAGINRSATNRARIHSRPSASSSATRSIERAARQRTRNPYGYRSTVPDQRSRSIQTRQNRRSDNFNYRAFQSDSFGRANRTSISRGSPGGNRSFSSSRSSNGFSKGFRGGGGFGGRGGFSGGRGGCRGRC